MSNIRKINNNAIHGGGITPTGSILSFASDNAPDGWMVCDGRSLSRELYSDLFSVIGTAWGSPDGTAFNIPDLRGRFLRGHDYGAGRDPDAASRTASNTGGATGDNVGSVQGFTVQDHQHATNIANSISVSGGGVYAYQDSDWNYGATNAFSTNKSTTNSGYSGTGSNTSGKNTTGISVLNPSSVPNLPTPTTQTDETRPINASVTYIIKY